MSQRGVVFFRNQDLSIDEQKVLGQRLGELTGKPETSKVSIVPKLILSIRMLTQKSFIATRSQIASEASQ